LPGTVVECPRGRPAWLANAERRLDAAVFASHGWPPDLGDDELLALNRERAVR
jgi:hypothetical protein